MFTVLYTFVLLSIRSRYTIDRHARSVINALSAFHGAMTGKVFPSLLKRITVHPRGSASFAGYLFVFLDSCVFIKQCLE